MVEIFLQINETQAALIKEMIPMYGENEDEVIETIIIMFFHEHINKVEDLLRCMEPEEVVHKDF